MQTIDFLEWKLFVDDALTRSTYANVAVGGADSCICKNCKNYVKSREFAFPGGIKKLFNALGVDYKKDCEVVHYYRNRNGLHHYCGWFHYIGDFFGPDCTLPLANGGYTTNLVTITPNFSIGFRKGTSLSIFQNNENLVQIEFEAHIPWIIDTPESE